MNRFFRQPSPGFANHIALALFAVAYLGVLAIVFAL
jgi:hypothetical protein